MGLMKIQKTTILLLFVLAFTCGQVWSQKETKPNILFIMVDDLGWTDISTGATNFGNGSKYYETPNVDILARKGMSFTKAYTTGPNCAPTRAALMSGQYAPRTKMYTVGDPNRSGPEHRALDAADNKLYLDLEQITLAEAMKNAGYATGHFGKWHLGGHEGGGLPDAQGFDINVAGTNVGGSTGGFFSNNEGAYPPRGKYPRMPGLPPNGKEGEWLDDRITGEALKFMNESKDGPFFIYLSFFAVHTPISSPAEDKAHFDNKEKAEYHNNQTYAGFIKSFDDNIGRLVSYLEMTDDPNSKGKKLIDNTMVVFYSDNGGVGGFHRSNISALEVTDQFPLRDGKGSMKEGGIRVPMIIRWDGEVAPNTIDDTPVITVDFYPTLLRVARAERPNTILDGEDLLGVMKKERNLDRALYWHFPAYLNSYVVNGKRGWRTTPASVIREGDWKLLYYYETRHWELYNLSKDIGENNNLASQNTKLVMKLGKKMLKWLKQTGADMPMEKGTREKVSLPRTK